MYALDETYGRSHRSVWSLALAKEIAQAEESKADKFVDGVFEYCHRGAAADVNHDSGSCFGKIVCWYLLIC